MVPSPLPLIHQSPSFLLPSFLLSPWHGIHRLDRGRFHRNFSVNGPLGRDETRTEVDRDKAREALRQLDQQLESLAQRETLPRKKRPAPPPFLESDLERDFMMTGRQVEEMPEISDSFLAYTAAALLLLTIVNNILFIVFTKPSADGNEEVSDVVRQPLVDPTEQAAPQLVD